MRQPPPGRATCAIEPSTSAPHAARAWVGPLLDTWDLGARSGDVLLVVSELVSNAVLHGEGEVKLVVSCEPAHVRVEVTDDGGGLVEPAAEGGARGGFGLQIVAVLADDWGVEAAGPDGKTVWALLGT